MYAERNSEPVLHEPESSKFRALFDYWKSKRNGEGMVLRASIDPVEIPQLLPSIFLVDVIREDVARYRFRLVGTKICDLEGNITGKYLDELGAEQEHMAMYRHYDDACASLLYIRNADLGWMGKEFRQYRVLLLPLHEPGHNVDMLIGLADYVSDAETGSEDSSSRPIVPVTH